VGNVMAKTSYDAWGSVTENNAVSLSPYIEDINLTESFTGYLYDEGTGLWNAGARTYDSETKRFLSEDPESGTMDDPISTVKYVYAYDNPVMNVDPDGRSVWGTITSIGSKAYSKVKSWAGTAVNAVKKTAGYVKDKVVQGIETVRREGRKMLDVAASYVQKVICMIPDGVKKVWNDVNKLYDKIPNSVKFTIGAVGVAAAVVTGAAPLGAAVGVLAGAMLGGAAMNAGIYAAGAFFGYHDFSWKEMGKAAIDGAADGALFAGIGLTAKGITYAVKNPEPLKAFLADETAGEINLSKFGKKNHAVESADTPLYESMMEERGISSTLTAEEKEACRAADLRMECESGIINSEKYSKASWWERMKTKSARTDELFPNPADEFSNPKIGPSEKQVAKYVKKINYAGKLQKSIEVQKLSKGGYEIVNGHHRWMAAVKTGMKKVPIKIVNYNN
ncbi:MAG: ParB N-terminal domain-containing protein, partial [Eubacterium sp.]|nr:ParB N-terminal domain-containing protein [Eubacterium sp.]